MASDDEESNTDIDLKPFQDVVESGLGLLHTLDYTAFKNSFRAQVHPGMAHLLKKRLMSRTVPRDRMLAQPGQSFVVVRPEDYSGRPYRVTDEETLDSDETEYISFHDNAVEMECTTRHPETSIESDLEEDENYDVKYPEFQPTVAPCSGAPITTTAAEHLFCIAFAGPDGVLTELQASYPLQLSARMDEARKALNFDCFEYKPKTCVDIECSKSLDDSIPTYREYKRWKDGVLGHKKERSAWGTDDSESEADDEDSACDEPLEKKEGKAWTRKDKVVNLYNASSGNFAYSRCLRFRVPLEYIRGIRLQAAPRLPGSEGDSDVGAVLILEVSSPPRRGAFAARRVYAKYFAENEFALIDDWTSNAAASKSTRYYIFANLPELKETAALMAKCCPAIARMLASTTSTDNSITPSTSVVYAAAPSFATKSDHDSETKDSSSDETADEEQTKKKRKMQYLSDVREAICDHCGEKYFRGHAGYLCNNCGCGRAKKIEEMGPPLPTAWNGELEGAMAVFKAQLERIEDPSARDFLRKGVLGPDVAAGA